MMDEFNFSYENMINILKKEFTLDSLVENNILTPDDEEKYFLLAKMFFEYLKKPNDKDLEKIYLSFEILKLKNDKTIYPEYEEFKTLIEKINNLSDELPLDIMKKELLEIKNERGKCLRKIKELKKIEMDFDNIAKQTTLNAINGIFNDENVKSILSDEELFFLLDNYYKIAKTARDVETFNNKIEVLNIRNKIWKNAVTNISEFKNGESFKFIVHNFYYTHDLIGQAKNGMKKRDNRISCSYISDECVALFGLSRAGFIYPSNFGIESIGTRDLYSFEYEGRAYLKNKEYASNLLTPSFLTKNAISEAVENNEELDYSGKYNEIDIRTTDPIGVYYIGYGEDELNPTFIEAKELAQEFNVPFININMIEYRIKKGLSPLHPKAECYIADCVVSKLFEFEKLSPEKRCELNHISEQNAHELAETYLSLKQSNQEYISVLTDMFRQYLTEYQQL